MKVRALNRREITLFILAVVGVILFLMKTYVLEPLQDWDAMLSNQIRKEMTIENKNEFVLKQQKNIQEKFKWLTVKYGKTKNDSQELGGMVNDIETLAKNLDIFVVQMQPRKPKPGDMFVQYIVDLGFQAGWGELVEFLSRVESDPFYYRIDSVKIEKNPNNVRPLKGTLVISSEKFETDQ